MNTNDVRCALDSFTREFPEWHIPCRSNTSRNAFWLVLLARRASAESLIDVLNTYRAIDVLVVSPYCSRVPGHSTREPKTWG